MGVIGIAGRGATVFEDVKTLLKDAHYTVTSKLKRAIENGDDATKTLIEWVRDNASEAHSLVARLESRVQTGAAASRPNVQALLSTVHGAKGLEWPFVVLGDDLLPKATHERKLLDAHGKTGKRGGQAHAQGPSAKHAKIDDGGGGGGGGETVEDDDDDIDDPDAAAAAPIDDLSEEHVDETLRTMHRTIEEDEEWRLVYVAMTRARRLLVLSTLLDRAIRKRERHFASLAL